MSGGRDYYFIWNKQKKNNPELNIFDMLLASALDTYLAKASAYLSIIILSVIYYFIPQQTGEGYVILLFGFIPLFISIFSFLKFVLWFEFTRHKNGQIIYIVLLKSGINTLIGLLIFVSLNIPIFIVNILPLILGIKYGGVCGRYFFGFCGEFHFIS